jgi:hypothetical protein
MELLMTKDKALKLALKVLQKALAQPAQEPPVKFNPENYEDALV